MTESITVTCKQDVVRAARAAVEQGYKHQRRRKQGYVDLMTEIWVFGGEPDGSIGGLIIKSSNRDGNVGRAAAISSTFELKKVFRWKHPVPVQPVVRPVVVEEFGPGTQLDYSDWRKREEEKESVRASTDQHPTTADLEEQPQWESADPAEH